MRQIRRRPFSDAVTARVRAAILDGTLAPGSRIRQEELAARLGVSRAPIREALLVLEGEGLVHTESWRGTAVAPLDRELIADIYEFRAAVDAYVAASLATRRDFDPAPFNKIVAEGRSAIRTPNLGILIDLDSRFHMGLYEAAGNRVLIDVMRAQWTHIRRAMTTTLTISGYPLQVWAEHAAILDAIVGHNVGRARRAAYSHTYNARTKLIDSVERSPSARQQARRDVASTRRAKPDIAARRRQQVTRRARSTES